MSAGEAFDQASGTRWSLVAGLVGPESSSVLDVGCRDRALRHHIPPAARYVGVDLAPPADVVADAEGPLPFADESFEVVVFADVLEHLDDPHAALDEGMRIASRRVVVVLPNMFSWIHRLQYLAGRTSDKYRLGVDNEKDRHRWLPGWHDAATFVGARAQRAGWHVARSIAYDGGFSGLVPRMVVRLLKETSGPQLWAWEHASLLERSAAPGVRQRSRAASAAS